MKIRRQKPIPGGRESLPSCVIREIKNAIEYDARKFRVSKSLVIAVHLATICGIKLLDEIDERPKLKRVK